MLQKCVVREQEPIAFFVFLGRALPIQIRVATFLFLSMLKMPGENFWFAAFEQNLVIARMR